MATALPSAITPPRRQRHARQHHRQQDEPDQPELQAEEIPDGAQRQFMGRDRAHELESERGPVVLRVPDQDRQEHHHRDQRREPGIGAEQPAPAPGRHQHEGHDRRQQHHRGEFRQQRQPREQSGGQPPARIAALVEPDQRPQHRDRKRDHRDIGRDLGHQQPVIKRGLRHQHRQHDRAGIMRHAPDDIGEQQLRDQHRHDAGKPHAEIGVAKNRGAEPDEPGDHRRMIEEGKHVLLRPGPVIGLVGAQLDHAGIDDPQHRHARRSAPPRPSQCRKAGLSGFGWFIGAGQSSRRFFPDSAGGVNVRQLEVVRSSSRRTPGPIRRVLSRRPCGRDLLLR